MNKTIEGIIFDWNNYWIPRIDVILLSLGIGLSFMFSSLVPITMFGMIAAAFNVIASSRMWSYGFWYKHGFEETKL
jgi:hypothetical protein